MFDSSKDLLYISVAIGVLWFAFFSCWAIFYLAMILKQVFKTIKEMRDRFQKVDTLIDKVQEKIDHSTSYLLLIGEGVKKLVEVAKTFSDKKTTKKKK